MAKRPIEPFLWMLFSAGGVVSALLMPSLVFLFGIAFPLGWLSPPTHAHLLAVVSHPLTRVVLVALCTLSLFHWAHRFRYTLYDGLQIKHLNEVINLFCYGGAILGSVVSVYLMLLAL
jgi:succinate dehydrogenase subunit D